MGALRDVFLSLHGLHARQRRGGDADVRAVAAFLPGRRGVHAQPTRCGRVDVRAADRLMYRSAAFAIPGSLWRVAIVLTRSSTSQLLPCCAIDAIPTLTIARATHRAGAIRTITTVNGLGINILNCAMSKYLQGNRKATGGWGRRGLARQIGNLPLLQVRMGRGPRFHGVGSTLRVAPPGVVWTSYFTIFAYAICVLTEQTTTLTMEKMTTFDAMYISTICPQAVFSSVDVVSPGRTPPPG